MKTLLIAASALAFATPAFAQMEAGTTSTAPAPQAATPPADATTPADTATTTTTTAAALATPQDAKALIASEFPTYDKDGNGALNRTEFVAWMTALRTRSGQGAMPAAEADGSFLSADKDKSKAVTLAELQTYLTKGA